MKGNWESAGKLESTGPSEGSRRDSSSWANTGKRTGALECKELESALFQLSSEVCLRFLSTTLIRWIIVVEDWRQKDQLESGTVIQGRD